MNDISQIVPANFRYKKQKAVEDPRAYRFQLAHLPQAGE